jgi:3-hydroxy-5-methyl-1-naphthoate 3-O-methyltransferase
MPKKADRVPSPLTVSSDLLWGGWSTCIVAAAVELDVFSSIASGATTAVEIASKAHADEFALRRILDSLAALKYLKRKGDRYSLSLQSAAFLVRGSELYMEGIDQFAKSQMMGWFQLAETVKSGRPVVPSGDDAARATFFSILVKCIFPVGFVAAQAAVAAISLARRARIKRILDVGAGAAPWSIPFAQTIRSAHVTVLDLPPVTRITREYAARFGVGDRYDYLEGDLRELDFGSGYDLITLGHIIHGEGRDGGRRLIERCAEALADRGLLLIAEFIPNNDRTGPARAMLFGINMLLHTPDGDVFTMKEYREWLKAAGFTTIKTISTPAAPSPLILAQK